jgi:hypothetical protein
VVPQCHKADRIELEEQVNWIIASKTQEKSASDSRHIKGVKGRSFSAAKESIIRRSLIFGASYWTFDESDLKK